MTFRLSPGTILYVPAVIPAHIAVRNELKDVVAAVLVLNNRLEAVIMIKSRQPSEVFHGKVDFSQPPWNAQVAGVILELHAEARKMERYMRSLQNLSPKERGGSSGNTAKALEEVVTRSDNADDALVKSQIRWLNAWCRRARMALAEIETTKRLPRIKGESSPVCPWCKKDTLRQLALEGIVFCIDPECRDEEKRRPKAQLEYFRGEMVLRWQDKVIGVPV